MIRASYALAVALAAGTFPGPLPAQQPANPEDEVRRATAAGNHARATALADSLVGVFPDNPSYVLLRASALAAAGRRADAVAGVRQLLRWDPRYARRALADSALAPLRSELAADSIEARAARRDRAIGRGRVIATIEERDLIPEGTAWDPATRSVLLGSLNKRKIVAIDPRGVVTDRVPSGRGGIASVVGIHVDAARGILWAASNPRYDQPDDTTGAALYAFHAATGRLRARYPSPAGSATFLNDLTTSRNGTVYVTDTRASRVWMLRPGSSRLESFTETFSPNGITVSSDDRHLFVATGDHVQVYPLAGGDSWRLAVPDSFDAARIDGLAFKDDALIAHHPLAYWRVARYPLSADHRRITGRELIEHGTADTRTSTTGEVAGDDYVYIGNGQLDRMNARTIDSATMDPVRVYRAPLRQSRPGIVALSLSARDSVALFDGATLDRIGTMPVGRNPHEIAAAPDGRRAYVADAGDSSITVIDVSGAPRVAATWRLPDTVRVHDVAVSGDGRTVWAASGVPGLVLQLSTATGRVTRRLPTTKDGSWMVASGAPGVIVAQIEGASVTVLSPRTGAERIFPAHDGEIDAAVSPDGREIWSVNFKTDSVTVFDLATGAARRWRSGKGSGRVIFTPDGRRALTVNGGDSAIVEFDVATKVRLRSLTVPAGPKVIALSRDGRRGYVSHPERGLLTMFDVASMTVMATIEAPGTPDGVAVLEPPPVSAPARAPGGRGTSRSGGS